MKRSQEMPSCSFAQARGESPSPLLPSQRASSHPLWQRGVFAAVFSALSLLVVACPDGTPPADDAGDETGADAGPVDDDAGPADDDAGPVDDDAGADDDAGPADDDAGSGDDDGGTPGGDDAGPPSDVTSGTWSQDFGLPGALGFGARVSAFAKASDGSVYVGGTFTTIGGVRASNVARYDGGTFTALGEGLPGWVNALALDAAGNLYAGGWLVDDEVGGDNTVMRWNGLSWEPLGEALGGDVNALHVTADGTLVVGGSFGEVAEGSAANLALLVDGTYATLGGASPDGSVNVIYEDEALGVCIGGLFANVGAVSASNVACYLDGAWTQLGDGLNGEVKAFLRDGNGALLVGGGFSFFDEADPSSSEVGLARLDNDVLVPHAGGVVDGSITSVRSLTALDSGQVLVGGCFAGAGVGAAQIFSPHAALLNLDGSWAVPDVAGGLVNTVGLFLLGIEGTHAAVPLDGGDVLVGGLFTEAADKLAPNIALLDEAGFETIAPPDKSFLGVSGLVNEMASDGDGALYVGGYFGWAGVTRAENVAKLEGGDYHALGGGLDGSVHALAVLPDGTPVAGGEFYSELGGSEVPFLARFVDGAWAPLAGAPDAGVFALASDANGDLLVGGDFGSIGGVNVASIARISDGVVQALGAGLNGRVTGIVVDANGGVIASGLFTGTEANPLPGIARFDGNAWSTLGGGIDGQDYGSAVALYQGDVVVGGSFESVGGVPAAGIARFDGTTWSQLGGGLSSGFGLTLVSSIATWDNLLFATGIFDAADGTAAKHVAVFDGVDWYPLGDGLNDLGESLSLDSYGVTVGGPFVSVGDDIPSVGIGRYTFGTP